MRNFLRALIAIAPFAVASPYGVDPRDTSGCASASSGDFAWTINAFTYSSSDVYSTPAHEVASGTVTFDLSNPALPEKVRCSASNSATGIYFDGGIKYACSAPVGSTTKTSFTYSEVGNELRVNQTWTCNDGNTVTFGGFGSVNFVLSCHTTFYQNPNYTGPSSGLYSIRSTNCDPVTLPLTPSEKTIVA
ncbi:hypothetical protein F5Y14DRAFT_247585 [Nemania sp. NC0429]|nr:hypothetical protein F5Y14DRAFT_247585 [Nemania sp. NC0429]